MEQTRTANVSTIVKRLNRLRTRIYLEEVSGIRASDKEAFLAFCQEQEATGEAMQLCSVDLLPDKDFFAVYLEINPNSHYKPS